MRKYGLETADHAPQHPNSIQFGPHVVEQNSVEFLSGVYHAVLRICDSLPHVTYSIFP